MNSDESNPARAAESASRSRPEPGGWEARMEAEVARARRGEPDDRLREGREHPLHHGHCLHGDHAYDGCNPPGFQERIVIRKTI